MEMLLIVLCAGHFVARRAPVCYMGNFKDDNGQCLIADTMLLLKPYDMDPGLNNRISP